MILSTFLVVLAAAYSMQLTAKGFASNTRNEQNGLRLI
jgi:hypothetical protein